MPSHSWKLNGDRMSTVVVWHPSHSGIMNEPLYIALYIIVLPRFSAVLILLCEGNCLVFSLLLYFFSNIYTVASNYLFLFNNFRLLVNLRIIPIPFNNPLPFDRGAVLTRLFNWISIVKVLSQFEATAIKPVFTTWMRTLYLILFADYLQVTINIANKGSLHLLLLKTYIRVLGLIPQIERAKPRGYQYKVK